MVEFAGFLMPVSYAGIIDEHTAVRERVGLFDVSHMGEFVVTGEGALDFVNAATTNDCSALSPGSLQYTVMCRENGTVVDDLLVFVVARDRVILVVNASNVDKDFDHLSAFERRRAELRNASEDYALIAIQGPHAREVLVSTELFAKHRAPIEALAYYNGLQVRSDGEEILVSRTGYTGEIGFEVFVPPRMAEELWTQLTAAGRAHAIAPVGLGARDTLRFEASYCLYGHELDDSTSPLEAGLGWVVKLKKSRFCGLDALKEEKARGPKRTLVGLELEGRNIARQGYAVRDAHRDIGRITSGTFSPTLQKSLAMALVESHSNTGKSRCGVHIRDKTVPAHPTPLPFYKSRAK
jgi:aminomethyltransferase